MPIEYEIKILDIDTSTIKEHLLSLWAIFINNKKFRRYVYEMNPPIQEKRVRLRTDWNKTTLTVKHIIDSQSIDGTKEREVIVDDFDTTNEILKQMWYNAKSYQENNRESYTLDWCDIEIDTRPLIPPYLEIEWSSIESVQAIIDKLWLSNNIHTSQNTTDIYRHYGIDKLEETYPHLSFSSIRQ